MTNAFDSMEFGEVDTHDLAKDDIIDQLCEQNAAHLGMMKRLCLEWYILSNSTENE